MALSSGHRRSAGGATELVRVCFSALFGHLVSMLVPLGILGGGRVAAVQPSLKARVRNGRLTFDVPTTLPEGAEVTVILVDGDELDAEERAELHRAIDEGMADCDAGRTEDAYAVIAELRARR